MQLSLSLFVISYYDIMRLEILIYLTFNSNNKFISLERNIQNFIIKVKSFTSLLYQLSIDAC